MTPITTELSTLDEIHASLGRISNLELTPLMTLTAIRKIINERTGSAVLDQISRTLQSTTWILLVSHNTDLAEWHSVFQQVVGLMRAEGSHCADEVLTLSYVISQGARFDAKHGGEVPSRQTQILDFIVLSGGRATYEEIQGYTGSENLFLLKDISIMAIRGLVKRQGYGTESILLSK